ncbi:hypothetical protein IPU70_11380 [Achromobacter sp. SD115]|uniref:hypothetical protein n=1 Tax=Achromobacter sp. SD115 TaxID=2782011 RepID=UPI001A9694B7|nr:hypothetical protein [Achromobacter sp. SD115]MBO1014149.1 hypothetical protein [Achromobacter sp. SD115]
MSGSPETWADWGIGLLLALTAVQAAFMVWRARRRHRAQHEDALRQSVIRAHGQPASARVAAARDTRSRIGETRFFIVELDLDVQATQSTPALARTVQVPVSPPRLADFAAGEVIDVLVDPATHDVVVAQPTE